MIQGLYAAASGMMAIEDRQAIIANNIANASTSGYKRQNAVDKGFKEAFMGALGTNARLNQQKGPGGGLRMVNAYTDFESGPIAATGNSLNVALQGPGYLSVQTPVGDRYTRNGSFTVNSNGQLATSEGYPVMGEGGPIPVEGGDLEFMGDGTVLVNKVPVGKLKVVEFKDPALLERYGESLFSPVAKSGGPVPAQTTTVVPNSLEGSNVQMPFEMAQMMLGLRMYNADQKVINSVDETVSRLINEVGMPT